MNSFISNARQPNSLMVTLIIAVIEMIVQLFLFYTLICVKTFTFHQVLQ